VSWPGRSVSRHASIRMIGTQHGCSAAHSHRHLVNGSSSISVRPRSHNQQLLGRHFERHLEIVGNAVAAVATRRLETLGASDLRLVARGASLEVERVQR